MDEQKINTLIGLLNEKEVLLKEKELALEDQQEEFLSQKEELDAAVEELIAKNDYLTSTLGKLRQRNQELDHILYRASHDLKTPVSSIYGLIEIMRSGVQTPEQQIATTHLFRQVRQMEMRLKSLTNLSTAFFTEPVARETSTHQLVTRVWHETISTENVQLVFAGRDLQLSTDPMLLGIALKCLIENAAAYRDDAVPGVTTFLSERNESGVKLQISDDGEGIDPRIEHRIFDMFYRGSERSKGLGLGLYIARSIAEKLGGTIEFLRTDNATTFQLSLPV